MKKKTNPDLIGWMFGLIFLIMIVGNLAANKNGNVPAPPSEDDTKISLAYKCQDAIKVKLKSPASAKFGELYEPGNGFMKNGNRWMITGFVDSQNSFGAMLRMNYGCVFQEMTPGNFTLLDAGQI